LGKKLPFERPASKQRGESGAAAQGGFIWLFAAWRGRADGADAGPLGAEILVCSGALLLSLVLGSAAQ